jgi:hypothetical protein
MLLNMYKLNKKSIAIQILASIFAHNYAHGYAYLKAVFAAFP